MLKIQRISLIAILFFSLQIHAQDAYKIKVKLNQYSDSILYLVNYYGNTNQLKDTAYLEHGSFVFEGKKALPGGIYMVVTKDRKYFEILVDQQQKFEVETSYPDFVNTAKFKNTKDNDQFYSYMKYLGKQELEKKNLDNKYANDKDNEAYKKQLTAIGENVKSYKLQIMKDKPKTFLAAILKASQEPDIPTELPLDKEGKPDSSYIYKYYKQHFFDGFNFADERILRTPIYANKLKKYFTKIVLQHPDSLIKEADAMIAKAKPNKETYKFCIWYFTYVTETSQIMGLDAVFVHLVNQYYKTGEAYWVNETVLNNIVERANTLENLLIGKPAPNMIMIDTNNDLKSLYALKADFTVVLFWDPDCGHCRHEIPIIRDWMKENAAKYNTKVFAVCSDTSLVKWKNFLNKNDIRDWFNVNGTRSATKNYHDLYDIISTPTIYILDRQKKIIAKRVGADQMEDIIIRRHKQLEKQ